MTLENDLGAAIAQLNEGRLKPALKSAKIGMKRYKSHPAFPNIAGVCLSGLGKHKDSVPYFKKALSLAPEFHDARKNMAQSLIVLDRSETALPLLERVLSAVPSDPAALYIKAQAQMALENNAGAVETLDTILKSDRRNYRALRLRGVLHKAMASYQDAVEDLSAVLAMNANDVEALIDISLPLAHLMRTSEATETARKAVMLAPDNIEAHRRLATQLLANGDTAETRAACEALLSIAPDDPLAIELLSRLNTAEQNAELSPVIDRARKTAGRHPADISALLDFADARIASQKGDTEGFARNLRHANKAMASISPYDPEKTALSLRILKERFPDPASVTTTRDETAPRPIYVVGMPRSGTTLTEVLLSAHPEVTTLGERSVPALRLDQYVTGDAPFGATEVEAYAHADISQLPPFAEGISAYVDKMPENYRLLGFLACAYPNARMVQLRRDPRDVALSIWQAHFAGTSMTYAYDLAGMADRFNFHARLMAHWHSVLPGRILELRYEDLVSDIEGQSKRLAEFCGLEWVEDMAHPERHEGQVLTFSATQLRQSVHTRSVGKWRKHAEMLEPFIAGLDPGLWPEVNA